MDKSQFRADFPEFTSTTVFPDAMLTFWSGIAEKLLIADRWADLLTYGVELFTAHHISFAAADQKAATAGGVPGNATGLKSSKSAGDVSVSYDTGAGIEPDAGHWNLSTYGRNFIRLARLMGSGGYQL